MAARKIMNDSVRSVFRAEQYIASEWRVRAAAQNALRVSFLQLNIPENTKRDD